MPKRQTINSYREALNLGKCWISIFTKRTYARPAFIVLFVTQRCNAQCKTCDVWKMQSGPELSTQEIKRLARELSALHVPYVAISGGEPLLRDDIFEIISYYKALGILVQLSTNGVLLNKSNADKLIETNVDRITVSIDAVTRETYQTIRGIDAFETVRDHLLYLIQKTRDKKILIETNTIISAFNLHQIVDLVEWLEMIGVDNINISPMHVEDKNLHMETKDSLLPKNMEEVKKVIGYVADKKRKTGKIGNSYLFLKGIVNYFSSPRQSLYPCYSGYLAADVLADGNVHLCASLPSLGNIKNNSFAYMWYSPVADDVRAKMKKGLCPNCYVTCKTETSFAVNLKHSFAFILDKMKLVWSL